MRLRRWNGERGRGLCYRAPMLEQKTSGKRHCRVCCNEARSKSGPFYQVEMTKQPKVQKKKSGDVSQAYESGLMRNAFCQYLEQGFRNKNYSKPCLSVEV